MGFNSPQMLTVFLSCALVAAALFDLRYHKIPNLITFPTMIVSLCYYGVTRGAPGILFSLGGLAAGIAALILFYLKGGMGAGDVKLMGAVGSALGPVGAVNSFLLAALAGGVYAVYLLVVHSQQTRAVFSRIWLMLKTFVATGAFISVSAARDEESPRLAYGLAIAVGSLGALWWLASYGRFPVDFSV
jgi:prepilin peptidase CpaA